MGSYVFDPVLMHVSNLNIDLRRGKDCAYDLLVLKLASLSTVDKLRSLVSTREDPLIVSILRISRHFMRLQLHAFNCKKIDCVHIISFLWESMTWMTSMAIVCVVTQRNFATPTIELIFLISRIDVHHPRHAT